MKRLDDLENGYRIWQDSEAFCFGIDAVLLAHYPVMKDGDCVMDLCTGNGVIPLIMHGTARDEAKRVSFRGLEIQEGAASLARESVRDHNRRCEGSCESVRRSFFFTCDL